MKLAIIGLGGRSTLAIEEEAKAFFSEVDYIDIRHLEVHIGLEGMGVLNQGKPLDDYDCIYLRGSHKYALLQQAVSEAYKDKVYMPLDPKSFSRAHNKFLTLVYLQKKKVPVPRTYLAATTKAAKKLIDDVVHYPVIMKIPSGTQGKGVMFADSPSSAKSILDTLEVFKQPYIIEEYVETGATDLRAIVIGEKVVAAMRRKAISGELRANIHAGGKGEATVLDYDTEQIAIRAAKAIGAEICGVDILQSGKQSFVIEINIAAALKGGISEATKKNVAKIAAEYLYKRTKEFKEQSKATTSEKIFQELEIGKSNEMIAPLSIKAGVIKLPPIVTKITQFKPDEEVIMKVDKGKLILKKQEREKSKDL